MDLSEEAKAPQAACKHDLCTSVVLTPVVRLLCVLSRILNYVPTGRALAAAVVGCGLDIDTASELSAQVFEECRTKGAIFKLK